MKFENSLKILLLLAFCFTLISFSGCGNDNKYDMSSLNNDMDDESDFNEYISDAKNSALNENFSSAYDYLEKARKLGVSSSELSSAKRYVASKERAYEERIEQERQARLERERQEQMAQQSRSYGSSSGGSFNYISVRVDCIAAICTPENFRLSGGPGSVMSPDGTSSTSIHDIGQGFIGNYSYSVKLSPVNRICSGSFNISGTRQNVTIGVYEDCRAEVREF